MTIKEIRKEYKKHIAHLENQNYEFIGYEKAQWAVLEELYNEGAVTERLSHIPDEIISLAAGYECGRNLEGFTVVRCLDLKYIYATKKHARALMMLFLGIEDAEPSVINPEPEQEEEKPEEVAMVRDEYGNEIFVGETIGECQEYCKMHGITGGNGEYIGIGFFTKDRYFEMEDTQEIESYGNWFNEEQEAMLTKEVKEASNHENVHNFMRECTLIEIAMKETTKNTEARQPKSRPPPIKQFYQSNFIKKEVRTWH